MFSYDVAVIINYSQMTTKPKDTMQVAGPCSAVWSSEKEIRLPHRTRLGPIHPFNSFLLFPVLLFQIDRYAQRDLKNGLQLFGTEGNVGLTNAWMIVQTDVRIYRMSHRSAVFFFFFSL